MKTTRSNSSTSTLRSHTPIPTPSQSCFINILPFTPTPDYDIVLKSSDGVGYLAHKTIMRLASTSPEQIFSNKQVFPSMCPVPSSSLGTVGTEIGCNADYEIIESQVSSRGDRTVYDISASSGTVDALLRLLYPAARSPNFAGPNPPLDGSISDPSLVIKNIGPVINTAQRLKMPGIVADLCKKLLEVGNSPHYNVDHPIALRVYITACRFKLADVAQSAAYACLLGNGLGVYTSELENIRGDSYFKLIDYRRKVIQSVRSLFEGDDLPNKLAYLKPKTDNVGALPSAEGCSDEVDTQLFTNCLRGDWWKTYSSLARDILSNAPRSDRIYSTALLSQAFAKVEGRGPYLRAFLSSCGGLQIIIKAEIEKVIVSVKLDISCLNK